MIQKILNLPFFSNSVRVFFTLTALWAIFVPAYTVCVVVNGYYFPDHLINIFQWHAHEMVFGFYFSIIIGFILTAGGHWSGKGPLSKGPLASIFTLWILEKIFMLTGSNINLTIISSIILGIFFLKELYILLDGYSKRNMFLLIIGSFVILKLLALLNMYNLVSLDSTLIYEVTTWFIILLVTIITGRIVPRFTKNFFKLKQEISEPKYITFLTAISTILIILNTFQGVNNTVKYSITILAGIFHLVRMSFWKPWLAIKYPTIGMLHIGYFFFAISLIYKGFTYIYPSLDAFKGSLHLILTGSVSFVAMNIMIRASLGHTGREVKFNWYILSIFACLLIGSLIRVFAPVISASYFISSLHHSMGWWTLGFLLYFIKFFPYFLKMRV